VKLRRLLEKKLTLAFGSGAALLALAVFGLVLHGSEPESDQILTTMSSERVQLAQAEAEEDTLVGLELPMVVYDVYLSRDPFEPVRTPPTATTAATSDDGGTVPVPDDGAQPSPSPDTNDPQPPATEPGSQPPATGAGTCTTGQETVCDGHVITLNDLTSRDGQRAAVVQVDTTVYTVTDGEVFADSFRVLRIEANGVWFGYGDVSFWLEVGSHTLK
jgi:hypothetical protein